MKAQEKSRVNKKPGNATHTMKEQWELLLICGWRLQYLSLHADIPHAMAQIALQHIHARWHSAEQWVHLLL